MQAGSRTEIGDKVLGVVKTIMTANAITTAVQPDARLADIGLTSIDMVKLMLAVEAEFDMMIPQVDITPENFQSVAAIERLIARLCRTAASVRPDLAATSALISVPSPLVGEGSSDVQRRRAGEGFGGEFLGTLTP